MTVKELKQKLTEYPEAMDVFIRSGEDDQCYLLNSVDVEGIVFSSEDIPKNERPVIPCLILEDI